jgi:PHD/YefM family antitoxin component YafN of YafNO toxin-antitoxin module
MNQQGAPMARVDVTNAELHTIRDAMRQLNQMVDLLDRGELEKLVLTQRGRLRAVVLPVETYAALREAADSAHAPSQAA